MKFIVLDTSEIHKKFKLQVMDLIDNDLDINELFNQAFDNYADNENPIDKRKCDLKINMLRSKKVKLPNYEMSLRSEYATLCSELAVLLDGLAIGKVADNNLNEMVYPYIYIGVYSGNVIIKSLGI